MDIENKTYFAVFYKAEQGQSVIATINKIESSELFSEIQTMVQEKMDVAIFEANCILDFS